MKMECWTCETEWRCIAHTTKPNVRTNAHTHTHIEKRESEREKKNNLWKETKANTRALVHKNHIFPLNWKSIVAPQNQLIFGTVFEICLWNYPSKNACTLFTRYILLSAALQPFQHTHTQPKYNNMDNLQNPNSCHRDGKKITSKKFLATFASPEIDAVAMDMHRHIILWFCFPNSTSEEMSTDLSQSFSIRCLFFLKPSKLPLSLLKLVHHPRSTVARY